MEKILETIDSLESWEQPFSSALQDRAIQSLEQGQVLYFPFLSFPLHAQEEPFLSPLIAHSKANLTYDIEKDRLEGAQCEANAKQQLKSLIRRYAMQSRNLINALFPKYSSSISYAKTSFRPHEIANKTTSTRKDESLLHVDSFRNHPVKGKRILRMFTNVNPHGKPRVWRIGEAFSSVVEKMTPRAKNPSPAVSHLLNLLRITNGYRTPYDHYMLQIHDAMKLDQTYQKEVYQWEVHFPSGSTWLAYTDQVSHAAMSGQYLFEQTYHLPLHAMQNPETTPQRILEKFLNRSLI